MASRVRQRRLRTADKSDHPTRQRLVEVTARQIQAVGYERVDVEAVLEEVGATKGALYHHFGSLNDLLIAGLLHAFEEGVRESERWAHSVRHESRSAREARDRLREVISASQNADRRPSRSLRLHTLSLVLTEPTLADKIAQRQAELNATATETFRELQNRGWLRPEVDPHALAVLIQAVTLGRIVDDVVAVDRQMDVLAWRKLTGEIFDSYFIVDEATPKKKQRP